MGILRFFERFFDKKNEAGTWPRPARGLPPERLYGREGFDFGRALGGAREVKDASTHQGWQSWTREDHISLNQCA